MQALDHTTLQEAAAGSGELFLDRLVGHARRQPDATAFVELGDGENESARISFAELDRRARAVAAKLIALGCAGRAAIVAVENGIPFVVAFVGCLYAGAVAVPVPAVASQRTRERLTAVARDAGRSRSCWTASARAARPRAACWKACRSSTSARSRPPTTILRPPRVVPATSSSSSTAPARRRRRAASPSPTARLRPTRR
ncbi:MAG: AMP-binding protein [Alphaproteobacteria bacterium]